MVTAVQYVCTYIDTLITRCRRGSNTQGKPSETIFQKTLRKRQQVSWFRRCYSTVPFLSVRVVRRLIHSDFGISLPLKVQLFK